MSCAVQFVASDSRMIVFRPADGQSPAIRNDNLQFTVIPHFDSSGIKAT